jgi:hypothetical protein
MANFGISGVEPSGSSTTVLVTCHVCISPPSNNFVCVIPSTCLIPHMHYMSSFPPSSFHRLNNSVQIMNSVMIQFSLFLFYSVSLRFKYFTRHLGSQTLPKSVWLGLRRPSHGIITIPFDVGEILELRLFWLILLNRTSRCNGQHSC